MRTSVFRRSAADALVLVLGAVAASCTTAEAPDGVLACSQAGTTSECPEGMVCATGGSTDGLRCYRHPPGSIDSGASDAMLDARSADAMLDAQPPDATLDARSADAMLDARPSDASSVDGATTPDADGPEAGLDAAAPDAPADAGTRDSDPPEPEDGGTPPDGWPPCEGDRRYIPTARSTDELRGDYCVQRRADRLIAECHETPQDCTCFEGHRLPEEWQCVLRPSQLRCFRYRKCRTGEEDRLVGCYDGEDRCRERYRGIIACEEVPLSTDTEACVPPEELAAAGSGRRAVERPGWGCCWQ